MGAITTPSDMKLINELVETGYSERITQNIDAMRGASGGVIVLQSFAYQGNAIQHNFIKSITNLITRRVNDGTGSDAAATRLKIGEGDQRAMRIARKIGPVDVTLGTLRTRNMTAEQLSLAIGQQIADAELADLLNAGTASLVGALTATTGATVDRTVTAVTNKTLTHQALVAGLKLFGDVPIAAWLMHSAPFWDLVGDAIDNGPTEVGATAIFQGFPGSFNKPVIVTDSPALSVSTDFWTFGLTAEALAFVRDSMGDVVGELVTGRENLVYRIQGEYDFACKVKGYRAADAMGNNPSVAALATTANWQREALVRNGAGFAIKTK